MNNRAPSPWRIALDLGHGGQLAVDGSTPNRAVGRAGALEKDLTLDVGLRVRRLLGGRGIEAALTRDGDVNVGLAERAAAARRVGAAALVSLHFNADADPRVQGTEAWVHPRAAAASHVLARSVLGQVVTATKLPSRGVFAGPMRVLDPAHLAPATPACLVELSYLTDPTEERRLGRESYREAMAAAVATGVENYLSDAENQRLGATRVVRHHESRQSFDIFHQVPLVPQLTGMSCWAAAAAMILGWRDCIDIDPEELARGSGRWRDYRDGLHPKDIGALARVWGLRTSDVETLTAERLQQLLQAHGPLWVGEASPGLHVVVIAGAHGDGTPDGTSVRVIDPWPIGRGERYTVRFRDLLANLLAVADIARASARILFTDGDGRGARYARQSRSERASTRWTSSALGAARAAAASWSDNDSDGMDSMDDDEMGPPPLARNQIVAVEIRDPTGAITGYTHEYPVKADPNAGEEPGVQLTLPDVPPITAREINLVDLRKRIAEALVTAKLFASATVNAKVATKGIAYEQPVNPGDTIFLRVLQRAGVLDPVSGAYPVNEGGEIDLPKLGVTHVGGSTLGDVEQTLLKTIADAKLFPGAVVDLSLEELK